MKKICFTLICLIFVSASLFSAITDTNRQEIVSVDSPIYRAMKYLYISTGLALPSTTGPWSMAEMDMMLSRIDKSKLSSDEMVTYNYLEREINGTPRFEPQAAEGIFGFTISGDVALEAYMRTNPIAFTESESSLDDWGFSSHMGDFNAPTPLLTIPLETWFGDNIYAYSSFSLGVNRLLKSEGQKEATFLTNILMVPPSQLSDLSMNFPYRAFASIGGSWWNFSIGRDKLRWGPGESGNLTIGDQIPYHNNARFTAFSKVFKYTFSISSFVHPTNYTDTDGTLDTSRWQDEEIEGLRLFMAHRLEWRIFDKVNMALTESIMYQSKDNQFDLLTLSPTAIFHNYYIRGNANSLLSFEVDYTFVDHWNLYGEMVIDEITLPGENSSNPEALGYILGIKTSYQIGKGMFYGSIEGAYTDPYLYLRVNKNSEGLKDYGNNFVVATPDVFYNGRTYYDLNFLGYRYGNDSIVGNLNLGYEVYGKWNVDFTFTYWADGTMDMNSFWKQNDDSTAPTSSSSAGNRDTTSNSSERNAVAHWLIFNLAGSYTLVKNLDLYAQFRYVNVINYGNESGKNESDMQFSFGVSYSF